MRGRSTITVRYCGFIPSGFPAFCCCHGLAVAGNARLGCQGPCLPVLHRTNIEHRDRRVRTGPSHRPIRISTADLRGRCNARAKIQGALADAMPMAGHSHSTSGCTASCTHARSHARMHACTRQNRGWRTSAPCTAHERGAGGVHFGALFVRAAPSRSRPPPVAGPSIKRGHSMADGTAGSPAPQFGPLCDIYTHTAAIRYLCLPPGLHTHRSPAAYRGVDIAPRSMKLLQFHP